METIKNLQSKISLSFLLLMISYNAIGAVTYGSDALEDLKLEDITSSSNNNVIFRIDDKYFSVNVTYLADDQHVAFKIETADHIKVELLRTLNAFLNKDIIYAKEYLLTNADNKSRKLLLSTIITNLKGKYTAIAVSEPSFFDLNEDAFDKGIYELNHYLKRDDILILAKLVKELPTVFRYFDYADLQPQQIWYNQEYSYLDFLQSTISERLDNYSKFIMECQLQLDMDIDATMVSSDIVASVIQDMQILDKDDFATMFIPKLISKLNKIEDVNDEKTNRMPVLFDLERSLDQKASEVYLNIHFQEIVESPSGFHQEKLTVARQILEFTQNNRKYFPENLLSELVDLSSYLSQRNLDLEILVKYENIMNYCRDNIENPHVRNLQESMNAIKSILNRLKSN